MTRTGEHDSGHRRISAVLHVVGMAMLAVFGFKLEIVIAHIVIMGIAGGFGVQIVFQLWSAELFPTAIRLSAQGVTFAVARVGLGIWSLAVLSLASNDFYHSGLDFDRFPGHKRARRVLWALRNEGKSLEQLDAERRAATG